jgi:hypothetical protein
MADRLPETYWRALRRAVAPADEYARSQRLIWGAPALTSYASSLRQEDQCRKADRENRSENPAFNLVSPGQDICRSRRLHGLFLSRIALRTL